MKNIIILLMMLSFALYSKNIASTPQAKAFAKFMHQKYHFKESYILYILSKAKFREDILNRYRGRQKVGNTDYSWSRYKNKILLAPDSIRLGREFMRRYHKYLSKAQKRYSVSPEIITAFIRVESKFGKFGGEYRVIDALSTLGLFPNRKERFFRGELAKLFILSRREHLNIFKLKGSFAGAMGCVQQVPSIQLKYGIDFDGNGKKEPNSMADCIGSIAKFLHSHKWSDSRVTVTRARVKGNKFKSLKSSYRSSYPLSLLKRYGITPISKFRDKRAYFIRLRDGRAYDIYLGDRNYRVITLYNASKRYALTVALYAKALRGEYNR